MTACHCGTCATCATWAAEATARLDQDGFDYWTEDGRLLLTSTLRSA